MNCSRTCALLAVALACVSCYAQSSVFSPPPVPDDPPAGLESLEGSRWFGRFVLSRQPDKGAIKEFADSGGRLVVNLRTQAENERVPFDEADESSKLGLEYVSIPVSPGTFSSDDIWAFERAVKATEGKVLVHCSSGNRAAAMLAAYRSLFEHVPLGLSLHDSYALGMREGMARATRGVLSQDTGRIMDRVHPDRLREDIFTLAEFGTRHTLSDTVSNERGIGAARRWIKTRFEEAAASSGRTGELAPSVEFDEHTIQPDGRRIPEPIEIVNVVCTIPGAMPEARTRQYYVLGHYDSRASDVMDAESDAPGANDDGSGVAACLELARVLSHERLDATVVLLATQGEEQGLYGARSHAAMLRDQGTQVVAALSNDIIGDPSGPGGQLAADEVRVFSEGIPLSFFDGDGEALRKLRMLRSYAAENDSPSRQIARYIEEVGQTYRTAVTPRLIFRPDRFLRGGDQTAFNEVGYAAVRFTEVYEDYTRQHQDIREEDGISYGDVPEMVDAEYLADVTRLNAATIVNLANAPSAPAKVRIIVSNLSNDTTLRWEGSPEPDVAGYQVVWRATTAFVWEHVKDVGNQTEATIDLSKDNWFFGVRAYDRDGYLSPVVTPVAARR